MRLPGWPDQIGAARSEKHDASVVRFLRNFRRMTEHVRAHMREKDGFGGELRQTLTQRRPIKMEAHGSLNSIRLRDEKIGAMRGRYKGIDPFRIASIADHLIFDIQAQGKGRIPGRMFHREGPHRDTVDLGR